MWKIAQVHRLIVNPALNLDYRLRVDVQALAKVMVQNTHGTKMLFYEKKLLQDLYWESDEQTPPKYMLGQIYMYM